jgi:hypothetical protein
MNYKKALTLPPNIIDSTINFDNLDEGLNDFIFGKRTIHTYFRKYNNNTLFGKWSEITFYDHTVEHKEYTK